MSRPSVTVLIDTFNHERFIEQAIVSVLEQDFPPSDMEILVVDDGSTDRTPEIARKFAPRVRLLRKTNGGQGSAFNAGLRETSSEIVAFLDGDDWWAPKKLSVVVAHLDANPEVGAVGHGLHEVGADGRFLRRVVADRTYQLRFTDQAMARLFTRLRWCLGTSRLTVRRALFNRILPIPEELIIGGDDWTFNLVPALAPVTVLDQPLCYYRLHEGNLYQYSKSSEAKDRRKWGMLDTLFQRLPPRLREFGVPDEVIGTVVDPIWVEAERVRLSLDGGRPWHTFRAERAAYRYSYGGGTFGYRAFNALVLGLTLVLPPRRFYGLKEWYSRNNLRRLRRFLGEPKADAPFIEQPLADRDESFAR